VRRGVKLAARGADPRIVGGVRAEVHRVEDADGLVEWAAGEPGPAVGGRVRAYTGYREDTPSPVHRLETPTGALTVILSFGDGFRAQADTAAGHLSAYTSFVVGMHDRPSPTAHDGRQLGLQITLDPPAAFTLLGVPLHELGNRVVELADLAGTTPSAGRDSWPTFRAGPSVSHCSIICSPTGWLGARCPHRHWSGRGAR